MKVDREQLSALLDGELDELTTARLLRTLEQDPEALADWEWFGTVGDALRSGGEVSDAGRLGATRALQQIAQEPAPVAVRRERLTARGLLPLALAASAAAVAFFVSQGSGHGALAQPLAALGLPGFDSTSEAQPADVEAMRRYIDFHREVAVPELQRTSFSNGAAAGSEQGQ